jgi:hypothetical protein
MATYQHVMPGMQAEAAATFADLLDQEADDVPDEFPEEEEEERRFYRQPAGRTTGRRRTDGRVRAPSVVAGAGFEPATSGL